MSQMRAAPRFLRVICLLCLCGAALGFARVAARAIRLGDPDFEYFYQGGACLLARGGLDPGYDISPEGRVIPRGSIEWYLPFVSRLMTLLAWLPPRPAGLAWLALNLVAMFAILRLVGRHLSGLPPRDWPVTQLLPFLMLGLFWYWEYKLNQINNLTLLLLVASFVCWRRGRPGASGLWLGLAVLIKITPILLILWFGLKRQYRVVGVALVTIILAGPISDLIAFGPSYTADCYRSWYRSAVVRGSTSHLILTQTEMDWRNQGLGAVASRWLHPTNYNTRFDNEPRMAGTREVLTANVVEFSRATVARIVLALHLLSVLGLIWLGRRPADRLRPWQLRLEWALFVLAMLWFMPVMRGYHLIWAYPAVAILAGAVHHLGVRYWWSLLVFACFMAVVGGQVSAAVFDLESQRGLLPNAWGVLLGIVVSLMLLMVVLLYILRRNPAVLPEDQGRIKEVV